MGGLHRGIRLVPDEAVEEGLPLLGKIVAGHPIEALPQPDYIQVPPYLRTDRPCYVLQVVGDSMCETGILDGDCVVVEQRAHANNDESVVALDPGRRSHAKVDRPGVGEGAICRMW